MKLIECYIENFGKLSQKTVKFSDGLNAFIGDNGEGKTTLTVFIKAMLYGIGDTKKTSLEENDRKHYLPWDGSRAGGSLTFSAGGGTYRIVRTFGKRAAEDTFAIYDEARGREAVGFSESVGVQLFGIDARGFERTVFLSERNLTPESDHTSITEKLSKLVGTDGSSGILDEAEEVLDEQRRYYRKKGGGGLIADTRVELSRIESELEGLDEAERRLEKNREKYEESKKALAEASAKREALSKRDEAMKLRRATAGYSERIKAMKCELTDAVRRKEELIGYFSQGLPTLEELDRVNDKIRESKRLLSPTGESAADTEYRGLREYFSARVSEAEVEQARLELLRFDEARGKAPTAEEERAEKAFAGRAPDPVDMERLRALSQRKVRRGLGGLLLTLGILMALCGGALGTFLAREAYILCPVGIVTLLIGMIALVRRGAKRRRAERELRELIASLGVSELYQRMPPAESAEELLALYPLSGRLQSFDKILAFLDKFDARGCANPIFYAREVLKKYDRYRQLSAGREFREEARRSEISRAKQLEDEAREFLAKYKTSSDDPVGEIRERLMEYSRLTELIRSKRQDVASLSAVGGTELSDNLYDTEDTSGLDATELEGAITALQRELGELERQMSYDRECAEGRSALLSERARLSDAIAEYERNYNTIQLTAEYLRRAGENMTSRYLGKTKESFAKYSSLISRETAEFDMDTGFSVSRREGALSHSTESYSRGMRDLYRLSARLALIDSLYESETPFIILDDPFASFDDGKVSSALALVERLAVDRQIIYFTCSRSRALDKSRKI